jgi:predicted nucleotidyltransferase
VRNSSGPALRTPTAERPPCRLAELRLKVGARIAYVFDYGDDWRVMLTLRERVDGPTRCRESATDAEPRRRSIRRSRTISQRGDSKRRDWTYERRRTDTCLVYNGLMTELALLARDVGVHERTLRRAVAEGSLRGVRPSPRTLDMSLSEREYVRRSWKLLSALRTALRTERNIRFALLFGSAARGTDAPGSDVDVLVSLRDPDLERIVELSAKLTAAAGRRVDVVRLEDAESEPSFLADVIADGRVLVDRGGLWARLRSREPALRRAGRRRQAERTEAALAGIDRVLTR